MINAEKNRAIGLKMLNPSQKDLEHGLELHKNSFVFDAYGFSPLCGGRSAREDELIAAGASRDEIHYANEEHHMSEGFKDPENRRRRAEAWAMSGVDCVFQNSGEESNDPERLIKRLGNYTCTVDRCSEIYERCTFPDRLEEVKKRGHKVLYMTTNGVPISVKQISSDESLNLIGTFFNLGVRMMHLTYNRRNLIGDGCVEEANGGLSGFGRQAIAEMNRCGVIPDVAHTGQRSSLEAAQCSKRPVVASHSAVLKFSGHCRAKDDEVIAAIAKTNGYIGICGYPGFLGGSGDINALLDTIDYVAKKFGVDHVAIGTDRGVSLTPWEFNDKIPNSRKIWEQYWGNVNCSNSGTEEQFGSVCWTNWPLFTVGLVMRGYSDADIRKIIGGNVLRVCWDSMP